MDKIVFADSWEPYFAGLGLRNFDDFYEYSDATTVDKNQKRNVQRLVFDTDNDRQIFFMKRFQSPHLKDMLAARRSCGRLSSQAGVEWRNAHHLLDNGITTYQPVCMGERTRCRIERNSFFVTRELTAVCFRDFIIDHWRDLGRPRQEQILVTMAELVRTLHRSGIAFPDLYVWHVFLHTNAPSEASDLSLIDLHRMTPGVHSQRTKVRDLSRLCWSMLSDYFDPNHKQILLDTYLRDFSGSQQKALRRIIERYEATLSSRRDARRYYKKTDEIKVA